jgi:hypothetical protein
MITRARLVIAKRRPDVFQSGSVIKLAFGGRETALLADGARLTAVAAITSTTCRSLALCGHPIGGVIAIPI